MLKHHLPNILSATRLIFAGVLWLFFDHPYGLMCAFFCGALTDYADGKLSRLWHCQTSLGHILDPLADKIFMISTLSILLLKKQMPLSLVYFIMSRDILILCGAVFLRLTHRKIPPVHFLSKMHMVCLSLFCALSFIQICLDQNITPSLDIGRSFMILFTYLLWATTFLSGIVYSIQAVHINKTT